jgi:predicted DNA-binding protein YlxM (UPF0122 family)
LNTLSITGRKRESYQVEFEHSLLWECALGIAAITNTPLLDTLEKEKEFERITDDFPAKLKTELEYVEKNNTWKSLLQLLHIFEGDDIADFTNFIQQLSFEELLYYCFPFVGDHLQEIRKQASHGNEDAVYQLKEVTKDNSFFPAYIEFIHTVNEEELKSHLQDVMILWFDHVILPQSEKLIQVLERDLTEKKRMKKELTSEEFVAWVTNGSKYIPEPSVYRVLLIPQMTYRPWTIVSDIEGTKVFYYPVANTSIHPDDRYLPDFLLLQKYKALGDEVRLRILKLLSEKDCTLKEITEQLHVGKSTAHHHLKLLRSASLVGIQSSKYTLKETSIASLSKELELYLKQ